MAHRPGQSKEYDYLFKLLIIGDSGKLILQKIVDIDIYWLECIV